MRSWVSCFQVKSVVGVIIFALFIATNESFPVVVNTWPWPQCTDAAWHHLASGGHALDAVEAGCNVAEHDLSIPTVGYGGSPDEQGNTTLDALIMDAETHQAGAVASMHNVKDAIKVARAVMTYSNHTLLVGEAATRFAVEMGFKEEGLDTKSSIEEWKKWKSNNCQPNYRRNVNPDPRRHCGPYSPAPSACLTSERQPGVISETNHDTIGMVAIDANGRIALGTSTNGAAHRIPGRVGDTAIIGAGGFVDQDVGGAAGTGDGDILMRYLVTYQAVESMRAGMNPTDACRQALARITKPSHFEGALVAVNLRGQFGGACRGFSGFQFCVRSPDFPNATKIVDVHCDP